ncbi:class I SAM-dependent methyltransferase [Microbispora sitophila]|uniref:class I SAM-dependent methyltransferase n=1 Tax=Microbispora sitophila TaxID=2771537 RepID=UPI00299F5CE0|nr:class I SAM-dependent methyltransferase [Microbispora sitophila]
MTDETTFDPLLGALLGALLTHPWVDGARRGPDGIVVTPAPETLAVRPVPGALLREFLEHWSDVYDWVYESAEGRHSAGLDLSGWRASDTGLPLPTAHMTDWLRRTTDLVLSCHPVRVLELGCGSGLLLHALRDHLTAYVGTDVSAAAVERLSAVRTPGTAVVLAAAHEARSEQVTHALTQTMGRGVRPDCVLLNSVTQCFPDLGYLRAVLLDAIDLVAPGGTVIVGDVRHAGLLTHYCRWVERAKEPSAAPEEVERRAVRRAALEEEMLIDPRLIARIATEAGRRVSLAVHARTMAQDTELTRYRYDLVLHVDPAESPSATWPLSPHAPDRGLLGTQGLQTGIRNALLDDAADAITPHALAESLANRADGIGPGAVLLDPADPARLAVALPASAGRVAAESVAALADGADPRSLIHEPLPVFVARRLPEVLHDHLRSALPSARLPQISLETEVTAGVR